MSKKSRKRNRKILKALAVGLGAAALMRGRKANQMSGMETVSDAQKVASQLGTGNTGTSKVVDTQPVKVSNWISPRMRGNDPNDPTGAIAQKTRGDFAREAQINARNTAVGSPLIDNPYKAPVVRVHNRFNRKDGGRASHKSGGRVKGAGIAKRGLGRAMKKGRK